MRKPDYLVRLYQLANAQRKEHMAGIAESVPPSHSCLSTELYRLALEMRGVESLLDREVLPTFMSEDAAALLLKMPNRYFFWATLSQALPSTDELPLTKEHIQHGVRAQRLSASYKYQVQKRLADLGGSPMELAAKVASRVTVGLVLIKRNFGEHDEVVDNEIFFNEEFYGKS